MENKTHYRKVFKSDHLGVADLEEFIEEKKRLVFTIKQVKQEIGVTVAGRKGNYNIAYFVEPIKPLVLNAINSKTVKSFNNNSPFIEDWSNTIIELYVDYSVKLMKDVVGGVRIKPNQPKITIEELTPSHKQWDAVVKKLKGGASISVVEKHYKLTEENKTKLIEAAK